MTIESFCKMIWNLSHSEVKGCIAKSDYKEFQIPKQNGVRTITFLPETAQLYTLQKTLDKYFLSKQELPVCVKGFVKGESYISYLEQHVGAKYFMRTDICNFFPSITDYKIKKALLDIVSFKTEKDCNVIIELIAEICTYEGALPQGACTSPTISNIVMARIDQRITKYCQVLGITYTRYADDMMFSSQSFDFKNKKWFLRKLKCILSSSHFSINYKKMKYGENEISLNGYVISKEGVRLSRNRMNDIRKTILFSRKYYYLSKSDPQEFLSKANSIELRHRDLSVHPFDSVYQFVQFLAGYRSYLISFMKYDLEESFRKNNEKLLRSIEAQLLLY